MATGRVPTTANSPLTAKGDLFTYSTAPARLAVGNDGEQIVADSSTSTGLRYQGTMAGGKNTIINGAFDIWQRGTSFAIPSTTKTYTADRWIGFRAATGMTISRQASGLDGFTYSARVQRDSGNASTTAMFFGQDVAIDTAMPLIGKTIVLSFYARAGANYSATGAALPIALVTGTNSTDQDGFTAGYTGSSTIIGQSPAITTSWQRFTYSATIASSATQFYFAVNGVTPVGTAGANDWFEITGVQVELGSVATSFTRAGGTIQGELAACQRYYQKSYAQGTAPATAFSAAGAVYAYASGTTANGNTINKVIFPVVLRSAPTMTIYSYAGAASGQVSNSSGADLGANSGTTTAIGDAGFVVTNSSGGTITPTLNSYIYHYVASSEL